jgi:hypothetical protein
MTDKMKEKWQEAVSEYLEPGESVVAGARGIQAKLWQMMLIYGYVTVALMKRYRAYVVTDRNVYVFQASALKTYKVTKLLEKRPLGEARVVFDGGYLTLDGTHRSLVAKWGPMVKRGVAVAEAASQPSAAAPLEPAEPNLTA